MSEMRLSPPSQEEIVEIILKSDDVLSDRELINDNFIIICFLAGKYPYLPVSTCVHAVHDVHALLDYGAKTRQEALQNLALLKESGVHWYE